MNRSRYGGWSASWNAKGADRKIVVAKMVAAKMSRGEAETANQAMMANDAGIGIASVTASATETGNAIAITIRTTGGVNLAVARAVRENFVVEVSGARGLTMGTCDGPTETSRRGAPRQRTVKNAFVAMRRAS
jgi:hypothetical protein